MAEPAPDDVRGDGPRAARPHCSTITLPIFGDPYGPIHEGGPAVREYDAHGLPHHDFDRSAADLDEACAVVRRRWTGTEPFDVDGTYVRLTGASATPKPVQCPTRRS